MKDGKYLLADYLDRRVTATGTFDRFGDHNPASGGRIHWALFQDVYVEVDGNQLDIGHIRVQHAAPLEKHDLLPGDKVKWTGRVTPYSKRLSITNKDGLMVERSYNLMNPNNIEIIERAPRPQVGLAKPVNDVLPVEQKLVPATSLAPCDLADLLQVKEFAPKVGGLDRLALLTETLRRLAA